MVNEITTPIFRNFCLTHFTYMRVFESGQCYLVSNRPDTVRYFFSHQHPIFQKMESLKTSGKFWLPQAEEGVYLKVYDHYRKKFNIGNLVGYHLKDSHSVHLFGFGSPKSLTDSVSTYLNGKEALELFAGDFQRALSSELSSLKDRTIELPYPMRPGLESVFSFERKSSSNGRSTLLTHRELDCIRLLFAGLTAKELAQDLGLSVRTVEFYLANIKGKLGVAKKSEIIRAYLTLHKVAPI